MALKTRKKQFKICHLAPSWYTFRTLQSDQGDWNQKRELKNQESGSIKLGIDPFLK